MNVVEFIEKACTYSPQTVEGKRRQVIISILGAALGEEDIKPGDDVEDAVEKISKTFPPTEASLDCSKKGETRRGSLNFE